MLRWLTIFLDSPAADADAAEQFWLQVTGSELSARRGPTGQFATLVPTDGDAYLRVQRIDDGAPGCHLDLHLDQAEQSLPDAATAAVGLGAREVFREAGLVVLRSPGGFTFCLVGWHRESRVPGPTTGAGGGAGTGRGTGIGGANRADQLCLDIPAELFEVESAFWSALTGWELRAGSRPEFGYLERPDGLPVRLLLQRRDSSDPGDRVTGHVDFGCQDRHRLAELHVAAGARVTATFPHWITLSDPAGRPYCLTARNPLTGKLRAEPS
jgi:hypothetical protein